jgi:SAM-dependent methyltransferase
MANTYYDSVDLDEAREWRDIAFSPHAIRVVREYVGAATRRYLAGREPVRWIDVGCGLGRTCLAARELGHAYTGIDSSAANIEQCRAAHPEGRFICGDWFGHSGEYDLVTFISVLHHFDDWRSALDRAFQLLSPGGIVIVDHEPTRLFARLFRFYSVTVRKADPAVIGKVEIHWFARPSILPAELPPGQVQYHFDFVPVLGRLRLRTRSPLLGRFFGAYRKIMQRQ